jgi:transposase-like protein
VPPRIPDDKRAAILADIRAGELSARAIGRKHGVAQSSVSLIAQQNRENDAFDRTKTERATRAKQADNRSRRAQLAADLLSDAERLRKQLWEPTTIGAFGGRDGEWHTAEVEEPPFADKRAILTSVQTAVRAHTELEKVDATGSADGAKSMLGNLFANLKQAWEESSDVGVPSAESQAGGERRDE